MRRIRAVGGFAAQALVDKTENPLSDFFRAVIAGLAGQGARLQAQTFGQAIGQGLLGIDTAAGSGLGTGLRCAGGTGESEAKVVMAVYRVRETRLVGGPITANLNFTRRQPTNGQQRTQHAATNTPALAVAAIVILAPL